MKSVLIVDFSYAKWYPQLMAELWPNPDDRPTVLVIPNSKPGSTPHEEWVRNYRDQHGGQFIAPFLADHGLHEPCRVGLIGFSAGCWGIGEILKTPVDVERVSLVLAIDGLHGGWKAGPPSHRPDFNAAKVGAHWVNFAKRAVNGEALMVVSYSRIIPPYVSTSETAHALVAETDAQEISIDLKQPVDETYANNHLFIVGSSPPGAPSDGAEAHIYQANDVQKNLWRTFVKAWVEGRLLDPSAMGDRSAQKILLLIGALGVGLWALYRWRTGT